MVTHKPCKDGYERNEETKRCIKKCSVDQTRDSKTKRCRRAKKIKQCKLGYEQNVNTLRCMKKCKENQVRDLQTGRCRMNKTKKRNFICKKKCQVRQIRDLVTTECRDKTVQEIWDSPDSEADRDTILAEINSFPVDIRAFKFLRPKTWLNNDIINFWMMYLQSKNTKSIYLSSHFVPLLKINKIKQTKRHYKNKSLWLQEFICIPINIGNYHWVLVVVDIEQREINFYDSMGGNGNEYLHAILKWLQADSEDNDIPFDESDWILTDHKKDIPQQTNGYDCGVFVLMTAEYKTNHYEFNYNQDDMPRIRMEIATQILTGTTTGTTFP